MLISVLEQTRCERHFCLLKAASRQRKPYDCQGLGYARVEKQRTAIVSNDLRVLRMR
jgi:hypothetical protein